jgi:hypothetical protein
MNKIKAMIWTEKYRPTRVSEMVGDFKDKMKSYLKDPTSIPNFLLYSTSPGTGKTTLAKAIINELDCDYLMINSSDDRNIDTVREKVKEFARTKTSKPGLRRAIFMDEMDGMCLPEGTEIVVGNKDNSFLKSIEKINKEKYVMIPSVNIETGKIENDKGILIDSGEVDFYEMELEDGRKIIASPKHPFFKEGFIETKLCDLKEGDEIIDVSDDIFNYCLTCKKQIKKPRITCSIKCKDLLHKKRMEGQGNSRYGIVMSQNTKEKISQSNKGHIEPEWKRKKQSEFMLKNNPMLDEKSRQKISEKKKGVKLSLEHIKKVKDGQIKSGMVTGTNEYEQKKLREQKLISVEHRKKKSWNEDKNVCEICGIELKTKNGNAGLILHHIYKDRKRNKDDEAVNICSKCHNYVHFGKRYKQYEFWKKENYNNLLKKHIILYGETQ